MKLPVSWLREWVELDAEPHIIAEALTRRGFYVEGIETHGHHHVEGIDKPAIKAKMHDLKKKRDAALAAHDSGTLKSVRRQRHRLNRQIRAHVAP